MKKPRPRGYYGPDQGKYQKIQKTMSKSRIKKETMGKIREYQWWKQGNTNAEKKGANSQKGGPSVRPLGLPLMASFLP
jgi:hypothetical protein